MLLLLLGQNARIICSQVVADEQQTLIVEQQTLKESQDSMVEKVIKSQMDLTDE